MPLRRRRRKSLKRRGASRRRKTAQDRPGSTIRPRRVSRPRRRPDRATRGNLRANRGTSVVPAVQVQGARASVQMLDPAALAQLHTREVRRARPGRTRG